jgi:predicted GNAT superfamily acetyltransferase
MSEIIIRQCESHDDFQQCVGLQQAVWRFSDLDTVPAHIFIVAGKTGGFVLGAFTPDNRLVGFASAFVSRHGQSFCFHSDMLAVLPEYQNQSVGRRLKLMQREVALQRGCDLIVWTFDPLQALNAHFNVNRLGAVARTYEVNCYGSDASSHLHRGLDTDRLLAEWWLKSNRVLGRLVGARRERGSPVATVRVPANINELKSRDEGVARDWQLRVREQFSRHFASGLVVGGFERVGDGTTFQYLLYHHEP